MTYSNTLIFPSIKSNEQAFALQYTSLILIVMTFVIGAFIRPHIPITSKHEKMIAVPAPIGQLELFNIFVPTSSELNLVNLEALVIFSKQHDVDLEVQVFGEELVADPEARLALALARSVSLFKHLVDQGLPPQSLNILANQELSSFQAVANVSFSKPTHLHGEHYESNE